MPGLISKKGSNGKHHKRKSILSSDFGHMSSFVTETEQKLTKNRLESIPCKVFGLGVLLKRGDGLWLK